MDPKARCYITNCNTHVINNLALKSHTCNTQISHDAQQRYTTCTCTVTAQKLLPLLVVSTSFMSILISSSYHTISAYAVNVLIIQCITLTLCTHSQFNDSAQLAVYQPLTPAAWFVSCRAGCQLHEQINACWSMWHRGVFVLVHHKRNDDILSSLNWSDDCGEGECLEFGSSCRAFHRVWSMASLCSKTPQDNSIKRQLDLVQNSEW